MMPQIDAPSPHISYVLVRRDASGERMNPCHFSHTSDEEAERFSADFLGIPELSEERFAEIGYFSLSRKDGPQLFPRPA